MSKRTWEKYERECAAERRGVAKDSDASTEYTGAKDEHSAKEIKNV